MLLLVSPGCFLDCIVVVLGEPFQFFFLEFAFVEADFVINNATLWDGRIIEMTFLVVIFFERLSSGMNKKRFGFLWCRSHDGETDRPFVL